MIYDSLLYHKDNDISLKKSAPIRSIPLICVPSPPKAWRIRPETINPFVQNR
jgi:hypothetical protein